MTIRVSSFTLFVYILLCATIISISSPLPINAQGNTSWINGTWEGRGYQLSNGSSWSIKLVSQTYQNHYEIHYPSLGCGGKWKLVSINDHIAQFVEVLDYGMNKCVNGGIVVITRIDNNYITFSYFSPGSKKLDASSTLIKSAR